MNLFKKWFSRQEEKQQQPQPLNKELFDKIEVYQNTINHYYHKGLSEFKTEWFGDRMSHASAELEYQSHTYKITLTIFTFRVETKTPEGWVLLAHHNVLQDDDIIWQHEDTEQGRIGREFFERFPDVVHYWSSERSRKLKEYLV